MVFVNQGIAELESRKTNPKRPIRFTENLCPNSSLCLLNGHIHKYDDVLLT